MGQSSGTGRRSHCVGHEVLWPKSGHSSPKVSIDYGLTPRELDVVAKVACSRSNKEIGQEFSISERTVKHHLTNIFVKLGVSSRLELAMFVVNHDVIKC